MHTHSHSHPTVKLRLLSPIALSFVLVTAAMANDYWNWIRFPEYLRVVIYLIAYWVVAYSVVKEAITYCLKGEVFTEFFLMSLATVCAFAIGEYPESVAVMLFYRVGEYFQDIALRKAQGNISQLIDERPDTVSVLLPSGTKTIHAAEVGPGSLIQIKPGEKLALDGVLVSDKASLNTAALTGESVPTSTYKGEPVLAGMINLKMPIVVETTSQYEDSKLSKILELVQHATEQKSPTELFIRKFARYYTPAVVLVAFLITVVPFFLLPQYVFIDWFYRALIFLVLSCPCALVISIPLSYFGGIGAASRNGILFKGGNFLDTTASLKEVLLDKTGTLTEGIFKVKKQYLLPPYNTHKVLQQLSCLEQHSTHPVAIALVEHIGQLDTPIQIEQIEEIDGHGIWGRIDGDRLIAGNAKMMNKYHINYSINEEDVQDTVVYLAVNGTFAGYITIADKVKSDALDAIIALKKLGIRSTLLSGDKDAVVQKVAQELQIDAAYGNLMPEDKVKQVQARQNKRGPVAFVGDGVNDAPVIALSDVGFAMGGLGSDAAIEIADVVIQNDEPSKIPLAVLIGRETKKIVWQNIFLVFTVKLFVLMLGVLDLASMWEAVFADVGVALLAILNAIRLQKTNFQKRYVSL